MKRFFFISLLFLVGVLCYGQDNTALIINTETGKKHKIKKGRRIIFLSSDYPVLTKAKVLKIEDEKLMVERKKSKRKMELGTKELKTIGLKTGGTLILGAVRIFFYFPFHNLRPVHVQYKKCDLTEEWKLVTISHSPNQLLGETKKQ